MRRVTLAVIGLLLLPACGHRAPTRSGLLTREQFVSTYVALRKARAQATSKQDFVARRERVLGQRGVTSEQMRVFVRAHGDDLRYMRGVWEEIGERLEPKEEPKPDSLPPRPPTPTRSSTAASS